VNNLSKNNIDDFLDIVCNDIKYVPARREIRNELYEHIIESKQNYIQNGLHESSAEHEAIQDVGDPISISKEFNNVYRKTFDLKTFLIFGFFIIINLLLLFTVFFKGNQNINFLSNNLLYLFIGVILSVGIYLIDYRKLKKCYLGIGILGFILNIFSNSLSANFTIISALLYILTFSTILEKNNVPLCIIFSILSLGLLDITTDSSSYRMVFFITFITYIILIYFKLGFAKSRKYKILFACTIFTAALLVFLYNYIYSPFRVNRLVEDTWQNEMISSRLYKTKFLGNSNLENNFTTETYFSFIYLIETYGKSLGILIIILFILLCLHTLKNLSLLKDNHAKLLTIGIISFFILQCLSNLFGILGILNMGMISLPFISYNDIGIIINMISIALLLSIYSRKNLIVSINI